MLGHLRRGGFALFLWASLAVAILFLTLPVASVLSGPSPAQIIKSLTGQVAVDALLLSFRASLIALVVIITIGTPVAWILSTRRFRGSKALTVLIELPLVLPPAVAGLALLAAFGPLGTAGSALGAAGIELVLTTAGVVVALVFVASPFYIRQAQEAFGALDPQLFEASRTLGASEARTLLQVAIPSALPALSAGGALAWARALGEFGATLMFAGSLRAVTQTAPLAIYDLFGVDFTQAEALASVMIAFSASLLLASKYFIVKGQDA